MSFFKLSSGQEASGTADASHVSAFSIIADNTQAPATIKKAELVTFDDGAKIYQITYKILDGEYQGYETRQKINAFDSDDKKRDRALNMLLRLHTLCGCPSNYANAPSTQDLQALCNKQMGIVIKQWFFDGKEGNYISEIHPLDADFKTVNGVVRHAPEEKQKSGVESALTRNAAGGYIPDDNIPF